MKRILDKFGYIDTKALTPDINFLEARQLLLNEQKTIKEIIKAKEQDLQELKMKLSCMERSDRTLWLLFSKDGKGEYLIE